MTGYQEILTDPSYSRQIVTLTYPHIGNYGINTEDVEAAKVHAAGLIIRDLPLIHSNFRSSQSLTDYLKAENIVAIAGIDTRKLTRVLREKGAQAGAIVTGVQGNEPSVQQALELARSFLAWPAWTWPKSSPCRKCTSGPKPSGNWAKAMAR